MNSQYQSSLKSVSEEVDENDFRFKFFFDDQTNKTSLQKENINKEERLDNKSNCSLDGDQDMIESVKEDIIEN